MYTNVGELCFYIYCMLMLDIYLVPAIIYVFPVNCRRYFFLITFRSYLYCTSPSDVEFAAWMNARPELGHLCNNLRIDK